MKIIRNNEIKDISKGAFIWFEKAGWKKFKKVKNDKTNTKKTITK